MRDGFAAEDAEKTEISEFKLQSENAKARGHGALCPYTWLGADAPSYPGQRRAGDDSITSGCKVKYRDSSLKLRMT